MSNNRWSNYNRDRNARCGWFRRRRLWLTSWRRWWRLEWIAHVQQQDFSIYIYLLVAAGGANARTHCCNNPLGRLGLNCYTILLLLFIADYGLLYQYLTKCRKLSFSNRNVSIWYSASFIISLTEHIKTAHNDTNTELFRLLISTFQT